MLESSVSPVNRIAADGDAANDAAAVSVVRPFNPRNRPNKQKVGRQLTAKGTFPP